jgi:hypothetical protein
MKLSKRERASRERHVREEFDVCTEDIRADLEDA